MNGSYFYITNWREFQHYTTTRKWVRLNRDIVKDAEFICASESQRLSMLMALVICDERGRLLNNQAILDGTANLAHFEIEYLLSTGFLSVDEPQENLPRTLPRTPTTPSDLFLEFWKIYPRKTGKLDAIKAWGQVDGDKRSQEIVRGLKAALPSWGNTEPQFIPHASTWLRGERFNDQHDDSNDLFKGAV